MVIREASARQIVEAIEAIFIMSRKGQPGDSASVAAFMGVNEQRARAALDMASKLGFLASAQRNGNVLYEICDPLCRYLVEGSSHEKRVIFRAKLEVFDAYRLYKQRRIAGEESRHAAEQVKVVEQIDAPDAAALADLFENWGVWSDSLVRKEDGAVVPEVDVESLSTLATSLTKVQAARDAAIQFIMVEVGQANFHQLPEDCREALIGSVVGFAHGNEASPIIQSLGNAIEAFLLWIADQPPPVNLGNAAGILGYAEALRRDGKLSPRHLGASHFIGQIRIAADHADAEEGGRAWRIRRESAREAIYLGLGLIRSTLQYLSGGLEI